MFTLTPTVQSREELCAEAIEQWRKALEEEKKWWANEKRKQLAIKLATILKG